MLQITNKNQHPYALFTLSWSICGRKVTFSGAAFHDATEHWVYADLHTERQQAG